MKKLNRNHFKGLQSQFPVLSKEELEAIMGGDDCFFHCMSYYYKDTSVADWEKYFIGYFGKDAMNKDQSAIYTQYIGTFLSKMGFSYTSSQSLTSIELRSKNCIMTYSTGANMEHAVVPVNFEGNYVICIDPENKNQVIKVHLSKVSQFYKMDK